MARGFDGATSGDATLGQMRINRRRFLQAAGVSALPFQLSAQTNGPYRYSLVDGAWVIVDGNASFNRPLPPSHSHDAVSRSERMVLWAGDRPEFRFTTVSTRAATVAELRFALDGKPSQELHGVKAIYNAGRYDYEIAALRLSVVSAADFEGAIIRCDVPPGGTLSFDIGKGTVRLEGGAFYLRHATIKREIYGAASTRLQLEDRTDSVRGACTGGGTVYLWFTSDPPDSPAVRACAEHPAQVFEDCTRELAALAGKLEIRTPDPYLDAIVAEQNLALDRAWHDSTMMHGVYSWHVAMSGWRSLYGNTVMGWHDRVQGHAERFFAEQVQEPELPPAHPLEGHTFGEAPACRGAIPGYLGRKSYFYNMGEVLLDMVMYDWQWTGDLAFMARNFDAIAAKLLWQDRCLDPGEDGLYENWLNAWNTDAKWHNGGGGIIASVSTWRASVVMAAVARRLRKDPAPFVARAARIRKACDTQLWLPGKGIFAEYKDCLGLQRLHEAPDQSSIYTPIDLGFCDEFQAYQMLRFTEYAMPDVRGLPRGGRLLWSSNWLPPLYSTFGLYPNETINTMLCYFRLGLADRAYELLKGLEAGPFLGPCPGNMGVNQNPDGTAPGHVGFSDVVSLFQRTMVEGLFGVQMNAPNGTVTLQPAFPPDWQQASMRGPVVSAEYSRSGDTERLAVRTARKLRYRFHLPARGSDVRSVKIDGRNAPFHVEAGVARAWVTCEVAETESAEITIQYGPEPLPVLQAARVGAVGETFNLRVEHGAAKEIRDPQDVTTERLLQGSQCTVRLRGAPGWHTFFVRADNGRTSVWLPVDFELRAPLEIVDAQWKAGTCVCALRNNSQQMRLVNGRIAAGGVERAVQVRVPPLGVTPVEIAGIDPARLSPGTNAITLTLDGAVTVEGAWIDWSLKLSDGAAHPAPLTGLHNQDLATLHQQSYVNPHTANYTMTVEANGRSWWLNRAKKPEPRLDVLAAAKGHLISAVGVPFEIPRSGPNACFVSLYENFPPRLRIPLQREARKLYFLLAVSTNQMQSRIENARITVNTGGTTRVLPLVNPENLDDWLMEPFALSGYSQPLGPGTYGRIVDLDLGSTMRVDSVDLECLSNEVLCGLLGLTTVS